MPRKPLQQLSARNPPVISLLRAITGPWPMPATPDDAAIAWIVECGLGPILWSQIQNTPVELCVQSVQSVKAADLTARLISAVTFETLETILDRAWARGCPVTLLKGVSVAQQLYPQRHWRPMRDIDLLVEADDQIRLEDVLYELGFQQKSHLPPEFYENLHHSMPFYHEKWRCWVEVHTALFPKRSPQGKIAAFQPDRLHNHRVQIDHKSTPLWCLDIETQLVYTAVHWGSKLTIVGGLIPIVDTLLLLKNANLNVNWDQVLSFCQDATAARYMALMLAYLERHGLYTVPTDVWAGLAHGRRSLGPMGMNILLNTIDDYLASGRGLDGFTSEAVLNTRWSTLLEEGNAYVKLLKLPWRTVFPPNLPSRYDPRRHLQRLKSMLGRLRHHRGNA